MNMKKILNWLDNPYTLEKEEYEKLIVYLQVKGYTVDETPFGWFLPTYRDPNRSFSAGEILSLKEFIYKIEYAIVDEKGNNIYFFDNKEDYLVAKGLIDRLNINIDRDINNIIDLIYVLLKGKEFTKEEKNLWIKRLKKTI